MCVCSQESCAASNSSSSSPKCQTSLCASNNMSFSSECTMEAWKCYNRQSALYKKFDGECQSMLTDCLISYLFPFLHLIEDCRNVQCPRGKICLLVKNTGEPICYPKKHCKPNLSPGSVCGTDGITYSNICKMRLNTNTEGQSPDLAHRGPCGMN